MTDPARPGWYSDPQGSTRRRWWNGISWGDLEPTSSADGRPQARSESLPEATSATNRRAVLVVVLVGMLVAAKAVLWPAWQLGLHLWPDHGDALPVNIAQLGPGGSDPFTLHPGTYRVQWHVPQACGLSVGLTSPNLQLLLNGRNETGSTETYVAQDGTYQVQAIYLGHGEPDCRWTVTVDRA